MASDSPNSANNVLHIKHKQLVEHWVSIDKHTPLAILEACILPRMRVPAGQYVTLSGTALMCPVALAHLLDDVAALAQEAVLLTAPPIAGLAYLLDHRHCSEQSARVYASIAELTSPSVSPALRCLRGDLQRFVATVAHVLAQTGASHEKWISSVLNTCWVLERGSQFATYLLDLVKQADITGQIVPAANASLSFGGKTGVAWLPDDKLLILLLILFGPKPYLNAPNLPPFLKSLKLQSWPTAIRFSSTTK